MTSIDPYQHTLKRSVSCCGVGLHTGRTVNLTIKPAESDKGIMFFRSDLDAKPGIAANIDQVVDTRLATTIGEGEIRISTTEHLMAALRGYGIDNAEIEIDSFEVPIMDGSAGPFIHLLKKSGRKKLGELRKVMKITKPIHYSDGKRNIRIEPYDGFKITSSIKFDDDLINEQKYSVEVTDEKFCKEIARARTFGFVEHVEDLWANGMALGGTLENVIAIHWDRRSILNEDGLRFDDEFIRHKVLDLIGDFALLGSPVLGHVIANRSGHSLHLGLMQTIITSPDCWEFTNLRKNGESVLHQVLQSTKSTGERLKPLFASQAERVPPVQPQCIT